MIVIYKSKESVYKRVREHYNHAEGKANGDLFGVYLQGSQNYMKDLYLEGSDVDTKAIYLPKVRELILGEDISMPELIVEHKEHIDRIDARSFMKTLRKPGLNSYEVLFTDYFVLNEKYVEYHERLMEIREELVRSNKKRFVMSLMGLSGRDYKDLEITRGEQEADIANFGYSRKRLANILRFNETIKKYIEGKPFKECLTAMDQDLIASVRMLNLIDLERARDLASQADKETLELAHGYYDEKSDEHLETLSKLEDIFVDLISHDGRLSH